MSLLGDLLISEWFSYACLLFSDEFVVGDRPASFYWTTVMHTAPDLFLCCTSVTKASVDFILTVVVVGFRQCLTVWFLVLLTLLVTFYGDTFLHWSTQQVLLLLFQYRLVRFDEKKTPTKKRQHTNQLRWL